MPPSKRTEYAWRGYGSIRPHPQGQGQLEGVDPHPDFQDLGTGTQHLTSNQFKTGLKSLRVGSQAVVTRRMGGRIDEAFGHAADQRHQENMARMHEAMRGPAGQKADWEPDNSLIHAEGQHWYDSSSAGSHAHGVAQMAMEFGQPYHTTAAIKANTAQNISPEQENHVTRQILDQAKEGVDPKDMEGSTYGDVVVRAGAHTREEGSNPLTTRARNRRSVSESKEDIPFALGHGHKKPSYYQSYVYPHDERTRGAEDRHMLRAANPDLSNDEVHRIQAGSGSKPTNNTKTGLAGASPAPASRITDQGLRTAAAARGLAPAEAQTSIWHVVNPQGKDNPAPVNPNQFKLF